MKNKKQCVYSYNPTEKVQCEALVCVSRVCVCVCVFRIWSIWKLLREIFLLMNSEGKRRQRLESYSKIDTHIIS
jgi:hypothetical protein